MVVNVHVNSHSAEENETEFSRVASDQHLVTAASESKVHGQEENSPGATGASATSLIESWELLVHCGEAV